MGYAKYNEDNVKLRDDADFMHGRIVSQKLCEFFCPYCNMTFIDEQNLHVHISKNHLKKSYFLMVNDKVVREEIVVKDIKRVIIFRLFPGDKIQIDSKLLFEYDADDQRDITDLVKESFYLKNYSEVWINGNKHRIIKHNLNVTDEKIINETVFSWTKLMENGCSIGLRNREKLVNEEDNLYLDGVFDYLSGCLAYGENRVRLYNSAWGCLSKFDTLDQRGITILMIIAYRYNWISALRYYACKSRCRLFLLLVSFYDGNWEKLSNIDNDGTNEIFINNTDEEFLMVVLNFLKGEYKQVISYVSKYKNLVCLDDVNLVDRIYFLKGCIAVKECDNDTIKFVEDKILSIELKNQLRRIVENV